jgi:3-isopropylmalate/(R)-2-methylmalate dehydratase small subunit
MQAFQSHTGKVLPFDRSNVDTDAILPKQYLKSISKFGYGDWLFDD